MFGMARSLGIAAIVAGIFWFFLGTAVQLEGVGGFIGLLMYAGIIGGPILAVAGAILFAISERRQTAGDWVGWAFIVSGVGWGFYAIGVLAWRSNPELTNTGLTFAFVIFVVGVGVLAWGTRVMQRAGVA